MTRTVRLFYHHRVFKGKRKATRKGKNSKQGFEVTRGNGTRNFQHKTPRTNRLC